MISAQPFRTFLAVWYVAFVFCSPGGAQEAKQDQDRPLKLELNVNRVLLPVVVRDKRGRLVGDLKKQDFQVFDNDKPRTFSAFTVESRAVPEAATAASPQIDGRVIDPASSASQVSVLPTRITVFVFDDMHLSFEDMAGARKAGVKALASALTGTDAAAVVSISGKVNSGLTRDRAKLQDAILGMQPRLLYQADGADCPKIDYYQADLIENKHDRPALQDAINQVMLVCTKGTPPDMAEGIAEGAARRVLNLGNQDTQATYSTIGEVLRRMESLPGQRTLILVSPGFLPLDSGGRAAESHIMDIAAQSNATISALDARGLYTGTITASEDTRGRSPDLVADYRRTSMKLAEDALAELAESTGGRFFHDNNDLDSGLNDLVAPPEVVYLMELSLDGVKPDGTYHRLRVTVDRAGVQLQARRGYFMPKPEKGKK